ncbi:MAG: 3-deoxy-D-manno-octulosonic acid transferase [Opitutales bacterium]|nr:3-deoxy-D-manno-octulosonic acid transferase [Opitutales bacterium]
MIWIYRLLFLPLFLISCPYYFGRMIKRGGYAKDFTHRFGCVPVLPPRREGVHRVWIQAVSVGETEAVAPLLRELKSRGNVEVILTTTTSTAYKIIREKYADLVAAYACFPMDFLPFSAKAWHRFDPSVAVLMEGELWPEHLTQAKKRGVPVFVVNARLSDKSFRRYRAAGALARWVLGQVRLICAGTQNDFDRFRALGVPADKIAFTGNMKFDVASGETFSEADAAALKKELGFPADAPVLLGSSTWPGEEAMLLETFAEARKHCPDLRLLICPRHAERRAEIVEILEKTSWKWFLRSRTKPEDIPADADVCVADTTGELRKLTHLAQLAFVGKSLPPNNGGQTPIECAALGVPLVYGPAMTNFKDVCRSLEDCGAAVKVRDAAGAQAKLLALLEDAPAREKMSASAQAWHRGNQGATARVVKFFDEIFARL